MLMPLPGFALLGSCPVIVMTVWCVLEQQHHKRLQLGVGYVICKSWCRAILVNHYHVRNRGEVGSAFEV